MPVFFAYISFSDFSTFKRNCPFPLYISKQFPDIMKQLSPAYTVSAEPVFLDHLLDKNLRVIITMGALDEVWSGVAIDHIPLTAGDAHYHIRYPHIVYFVGKP